MKQFLISAIKIATGIVISIVALALLGWLVYAISDHRSQIKNAALAEPRRWPPITIAALDNSTVTLSTVWRDGRLSYQFAVDKYPPAARAARDSMRTTMTSLSAPGFTISFLDKAGFKLFDFRVELGETTQVVDDRGQGIGMKSRSDTYVSAENYRSAASWDVTWNFGVHK